MESYDTLIIGAGAAGLFCAVHAAAGGARVQVIDHAKAPGEKIRISGGGRCNFTNLHAAPENFLSQNPHFVKSALSRYTQHDFIDLVNRHGIAWHEKTLGQLFCDGSAKEIIAMLLAEIAAVGAELSLNTSVGAVRHAAEGFEVELGTRSVHARNLVVACGGKSIPKMGATGFGYHLAQQFGLRLVTPRPALVPLTFDEGALAMLRPLAGVSAPATVYCNEAAFEEGMLITHRGLSGPSILQISSFWREGDPIRVALIARERALSHLKVRRSGEGRRQIVTILAELVPKRLAEGLADQHGLAGRIGDCPDVQLDRIAEILSAWTLHPTGTEGYRTAEVTLGGVDTDDLSARDLSVRGVPGLYFIGEVVDVTGWLGGYNFQWAWSSGWACGTALAAS